jgi:DNA-binding transcriptional LysR family regulator
MMSFKQLEAVYWVAKLGGFSQAAQKLHTTQSAVSKRVQELELLFSTPLFDRSLRAARLTQKGEEMVTVARRLLEQRDAAVQQFAQTESVERHLRIGVTELTAMTWLPRLVGQVKAHYPHVKIEPQVNDSVALRESLLTGDVDLIIAPDMFEDAGFAKHRIGSVRNAWMCKPGLLPSGKPLRMRELAARTLLTQGQRSGTGFTYEGWLKSIGVTPSNTIVSSNLIAIIGMTVSGLGVSHLPQDCLRPMLDAGLLETVKVSPSLPDITYVAVCKSEQRSSFVASIVTLAQNCCDFTRAFQLAD